MKILLYDIETAPLISYNWGIYQQDAIRVVKQWHILSFAYKWLDGKKTHVYGLIDYPGYRKDPSNDRKLVEHLHRLFDEADVIIAHNGNRFDQKKVHARFAFHGLLPPQPYEQIDTRQVASRYFAFTSNRLNDLGEYLGVGHKVPTGGFALWEGCMRGEKRAWKIMKQYNRQDVILLEQVYLALRPWMTAHPAVNVINAKADGCPVCGKGPLHKRGLRSTKISTFQRYQCQACGAWTRERIGQKTEVKYVT